MCYQSFARIAKTFDKNPNGKLIKIKSFIKSAEKLDRRRRRLVRLYYARISLFPFLAIRALTRKEKKKKREKEERKERSEFPRSTSVNIVAENSSSFSIFWKKYSRDNNLAAVNHAFYSRFKQIGLGDS